MKSEESAPNKTSKFWVETEKTPAWYNRDRSNKGSPCTTEYERIELKRKIRKKMYPPLQPEPLLRD